MKAAVALCAAAGVFLAGVLAGTVGGRPGEHAPRAIGLATAPGLASRAPVPAAAVHAPATGRRHDARRHGAAPAHHAQPISQRSVARARHVEVRRRVVTRSLRQIARHEHRTAAQRPHRKAPARAPSSGSTPASTGSPPLVADTPPEPAPDPAPAPEPAPTTTTQQPPPSQPRQCSNSGPGNCKDGGGTSSDGSSGGCGSSGSGDGGGGSGRNFAC